MRRKGIILAGGAGTRLHPMTAVVVKQLLPVYDKPMIYYPLSTLLQAGIRDILVITTPADAPAFQSLLGDGSKFGVVISYATQPRPEGIAQAFIIGRDFIGDDPACLILGDNIFFGHGLEEQLERANRQHDRSTVFAYRVNDPERYGVIRFGADGQPIEIVEKPTRFVSNHAVTGLYFYSNDVIDISAAIRPSARDELEITDVNRAYLERGRLDCVRLGPGYAWLDAGTPDSLLEAAQFVQTIERRQGQRVSCPEEIAARRGYISPDQMRAAASDKSAYGRYLLAVADELDGHG
jgi:glucose-1-phosphate thymidylyltransferase